MASESDLSRSALLQSYTVLVRDCETDVLQYHRDTDSLRPWDWPSTTESRVQPCDLCSHRSSHRMLGPCCFCPMMKATNPDFIEAPIYRASVGPFAGMYLASCAHDRCGYMVVMDYLYHKSVHIKKYPHREFGEQVPPRVKHASEDALLRRALGKARPLKRSYAMLDINAPAIPAPTHTTRRPTVRDLLEKLDSELRPGVTDTQFKTLFVRCECGMIATRRVFAAHSCIVDLSEE